MTATAAPPTTELSVADPRGLPGWGALGAAQFGPNVRVSRDDRERVRELRWPYSVRTTFPWMADDTQLKALERGTILPVTRYAWGVDPNGADPAHVQAICTDYNLPLLDDAIEAQKSGRPGKPVGRAKNRFSFGEHRGEALKMIRLGATDFEQQGGIGLDGLWHPTKLAEIPARSIISKYVNEQTGGLAGIKQMGIERKPIPVTQLVVYVWDRAERGDWFGTSMYRACYREWLIKDRLLRVDLVNHEKAGGMFSPIAPENATPAERAAIAQVGELARVGDGMAWPAGTNPNFIRASSTDVIASINRHDEAMSRAWLLMAIQLGSTHTGARSVGEVQQELWGYFQEAIATQFRDTFNEHVIEDYIDWNYGENIDLVPRLGFMPPEAVQTPLSVGGAVVDPATQAALNGAPAAQVAALRAAYNGENRRYRKALASILPLIFDDTEMAVIGDIVEHDAELEDELHTALAEHRVKPTRGKPATARAAVSLPDRQLRREPYDHEVRAEVDFKQLDTNWQNTRDQLVADWQTIKTGQIAQLVSAIEAAGGDLSTLAQIQAAVAGADLIAARLKAMGNTGSGEAVAEATAQGVTATAPELAALEAELTARSAALAQLLASTLSQAAATKAINLTSAAGSAPADVAAQVGAYLDGLGDTYLADQFGGALSAAQNGGRLAAMAEAGPGRYYASELLDTSTCQPCEDEDGTEFATAEEAAAAYPAGGFKDCQGGPRCRGLLVKVYDEAEASA